MKLANLSRHASVIAVALTVFGPSPRASGATVNVTCAGTSDGAAMNAAIAGSSVGDTIQFHGTCVTSQTIVLLGKRNYIGDHRNVTTIRQAAGANLSALLASDSWVNNSATSGDPISIAHLNLDGNSSANSGTNVLVIRSWLSHIYDLIVQNAPGDGILLPSLASNGSTNLSSTEVNGVIENVWVKASGSNGIEVSDSSGHITDWFLLDSAVEASTNSAIYLGNAAGWLLRGNHIYGVGKDGILASHCYGTTIQDSYIEQFGTSGGSGNTWYGIIASLSDSAASVISGNKIFMFQGTTNAANLIYIAVTGHDGFDQATVSGNTILGHSAATETGLSYTLGSGTSMFISTTGNSVQRVGTPITVGTSVTTNAGR
jgi:hypothetical protein